MFWDNDAREDGYDSGESAPSERFLDEAYDALGEVFRASMDHAATIEDRIQAKREDVERHAREIERLNEEIEQLKDEHDRLHDVQARLKDAQRSVGDVEETDGETGEETDEDGASKVAVENGAGE
ncbi:hypothetical protein [Halomarina pelagica]|uniref:hypothetical protein n=1 Tax=Halomarina pelagica TaxID=2961599 RepID=UPI0020C1C783|nr:hypothetical protein [Halomarina sp. BND7]